MSSYNAPSRPTLVSTEVIYQDTPIGEIASIIVGENAKAFAGSQSFKLSAGTTVSFGEAEGLYLMDASLVTFNFDTVVVSGKMYGHPEIASGTEVSFDNPTSLTLASGEKIKFDELISVTATTSGHSRFRVSPAGQAPAPL